MTIVIAAQIDVDPAKRAQVIADAKPFIDGALSQEGCIRYDWSPDPFNDARILVFEEWTGEEALASHFQNTHYWSMREHIGKAGITGSAAKKYRVDATAPVYNEKGEPDAGF